MGFPPAFRCQVHLLLLLRLLLHLHPLHRRRLQVNLDFLLISLRRRLCPVLMLMVHPLHLRRHPLLASLDFPLLLAYLHLLPCPEWLLEFLHRLQCLVKWTVACLLHLLPQCRVLRAPDFYPRLVSLVLQQQI